MKKLVRRSKAILSKATIRAQFKSKSGNLSLISVKQTSVTFNNNTMSNYLKRALIGPNERKKHNKLDRMNEQEKKVSINLKFNNFNEEKIETFLDDLNEAYQKIEGEKIKFLKADEADIAKE
ncbi:hypothetical protein BKI52_28225 [marine bacterium AO1-C]|nr:hypothetical protein BKI52_28225 [marine bacterium AO1-C]